MTTAIPAATCIFEDGDATEEAKGSRAARGHKKTTSVGEFLRGRRNKENDTYKVRTDSPSAKVAETPLGERHINSPPQVRWIPIEDEESRPTMHKKTKSSISFRSMVKEKSSGSGSSASMSPVEERAGQNKPKKSKSSTNLATLLKRRSKKNLRDELPKSQENVSPPTSANGNAVKLPIWAQFATQPLEDGQSRLQYPTERNRAVQEEIKLYTPKEAGQYRPSQQTCYNQSPALVERLPQRPYLEHRSSRSSMFKEDLNGVTDAQAEQKPVQNSGTKGIRVQPESRPPYHSQPSEIDEKRSSRVMTAMETLTFRSRQQALPARSRQMKEPRALEENDINSALELLLDARNIAPNMRNQMRGLDISMKLKLIENQRGGSGSSTTSAISTTTHDQKKDNQNRARIQTEVDGSEAKPARPRPRSRAFTLTKRDDSASPTKKQKGEDSIRSRSKPRPKSVDVSSTRPDSSRSLLSSTSISSLFSSKPDAAAVPADFIHYLREVEKPELIEIGKMHKLRILLRNESIDWTDTFVKRGGMDEVVNLLYRIIQVEWREEHEDTLLHETLLCLKGLCTTSLALQRLAEIEATLFPKLLALLFDEEKKGPSEFSTRGIIIALLFAHLSASLHTDGTILAARARTIFSYLRDPAPEEAKKPFDFIEQMHLNRPYRVWCKEVVNVTKEVFWIFLHHLNVIPLVHPNASTTQQNSSGDAPTSYTARHFPTPRAPHPAAPYVGGVEWEATSYLAVHLDLLNGLLASLLTQSERNSIREEMRASGWEKVMGCTMRTCKEKFYGGVHEGLKVWVKAAAEDGWAVEGVRCGVGVGVGGSPRKSPVKIRKKKMDGDAGVEEEAPRIGLDVIVGGGGAGAGAGAVPVLAGMGRFDGMAIGAGSDAWI